jgi:hypothetical protein
VVEALGAQLAQLHLNCFHKSNILLLLLGGINLTPCFCNSFVRVNKIILPFVAALGDMYSALVVESAIIVCILEAHVIEQFAYLTTYPVCEKQLCGLIGCSFLKVPAKLASAKHLIPFNLLIAIMIFYSVYALSNKQSFLLSFCDSFLLKLLPMENSSLSCTPFRVLQRVISIYWTQQG